MPDKKSKACCPDKKSGKPAASNDQLGENAGEGRLEKQASKGGKSR